MPVVRFISVLILSVSGLSTWAAEPSSLKQTSAVVWLAPQDLENTQLIVNAASRGRYTLKVENPEVVEAWIKNQSRPGLVRVEVELLARGAVKVISIQPARTRRVPTYDSELVAVGRGNG